MYTTGAQLILFIHLHCVMRNIHRHTLFRLPRPLTDPVDYSDLFFSSHRHRLSICYDDFIESAGESQYFIHRLSCTVPVLTTGTILPQKKFHKKTVDPLDLLSFILKKKPSFRILLHPNRKTFSIIFSLFLHYFSLARIAFTSSTSLSVAAAICSAVKPFLYIFRIRLASPSGDGEIAQKQIFQLDEERIREESMYDGFYAVVTNLEGDVRDIININRRRWEIEENFRIMKTEFEAQPFL